MTLRTATFSATRWTAASAILRAGVQLLQTAVLARLLVPADFGLMAMAGVALAVAALFLDLGLSSALMHFPLPDRHTLSTLYWLNLGAACLMSLLFAALGWPLAHIYGQPELQPLLTCLALGFPLGALGQQFRVLAEKDLRFKPVAQNEMASAVAGLGVAVLTAWLGWGVFAIVAAQLTGSLLNSLLAWLRLSAGIKPQWAFRWPLARPFIAFGLHRIGDGFWNTAREQADIFIAGLFAPPHAVAAYAVPKDQSLKLANTVINPVISRVGLPVMTQLQHDAAALQRVYLQTLRITASFNFPLYALLAVFAEPFVALLLGPQWQAATTFLRLFAIWGLIRSTMNPSGSLLYAVGMAKRAHIWNLLLFFGTVPCFWLAMQQGGLLMLAWALIYWAAIVFMIAWRFLIRPACDVGFAAYFANLLPPLAATAIASAAAWAVAALLPPIWQLPVGVTAFVCVYLVSCWFFNREWLNTLVELLGPIMRKSS